jgi:hypothetical protein
MISYNIQGEERWQLWNEQLKKNLKGTKTLLLIVELSLFWLWSVKVRCAKDQPT